MSNRKKSKQAQKLRGPSRPVDPRYTARRISPKKGADTFAIWLVGISTALVVLLVFWVATANKGNTATQATTSVQQPTGAVAIPTPLPADATTTALAYATQTGDLARISVNDLKALQAANNVKIVDVRTKDLYGQKHIKGATSVPEADMLNRIKDFPKTGNLVVYCQ